MAVWPSWQLEADSTLLEVPASTRPTEGSQLAFWHNWALVQEGFGGSGGSSFLLQVLLPTFL